MIGNWEVNFRFARDPPGIGKRCATQGGFTTAFFGSEDALCLAGWQFTAGG
jgi:hypothetical protein